MPISEIPLEDKSRAYFSFSLRDGPLTDSLVLNLSARRKFSLGSVDFSFTTLDIADNNDNYYVRGASELLRALKTFVAENGFRFVFLVGSSKGGVRLVDALRPACRRITLHALQGRGLQPANLRLAAEPAYPLP